MQTTEEIKPNESSAERMAIIPSSPDAFKAKLEAIAERPDTTNLEIENEAKDASADVATFGSRVGYGEVDLAQAEADLKLELEPLKTAAEQQAAAVFAETTAEAVEVPLSTPTPSVDTAPAITPDVTPVIDVVDTSAPFARPTTLDASAPEPGAAAAIMPNATPDASLAPVPDDAIYIKPDSLDVSEPEPGHAIAETVYGPKTEAEAQAAWEAGIGKRIAESPERAGTDEAQAFVEFNADEEIAANQQELDVLHTAPESARDVKFQNRVDELEYANGIVRKQKLIAREQVEAQYLQREKDRIEQEIEAAQKEIEPLLQMQHRDALDPDKTGSIMTPAQAVRFEELRTTLGSLGSDLQEVTSRLEQKAALILNLQDTVTSLGNIILKLRGEAQGAAKKASAPSVSAEKQMGSASSSSALEGRMTMTDVMEGGVEALAWPFKKWLAFTIDPKASSDATIKFISEIPKLAGEKWDKFRNYMKGKKGAAPAPTEH